MIIDYLENILVSLYSCLLLDFLSYSINTKKDNYSRLYISYK